jgi:MYXO-CTERM domain-containing protein
MAMLRRFFIVFPAFAVLLATCMARASPIYPPQIASHLHLPCVPPCTICHRDLSGGTGTVNKRFGMNMQALYGLQPENLPLLDSVLDKLVATMPPLDSDGDGDTDLEALMECRDPNVPKGSSLEPPQYGCATSHGSGKGAAVGGLLGAIGMVTALRRRRRT